MDYSPWGHKESDTTEQLTLSLFTFSGKQAQSRTEGLLALGGTLSVAMNA